MSDDERVPRDDALLSRAVRAEVCHLGERQGRVLELEPVERGRERRRQRAVRPDERAEGRVAAACRVAG